MSKRNKKLLSLLLSTMMVFSVVPSTVYAAPDQETEATIEQDANEEVKQEDTVNNEADASADQTDTKQDETKADDTAQKNDEAVTQTGDEATPAVDNTVTVSGTSIQIPTIQFKGANAAVAEALTKDVEIDESNPAIKGLRKELENLEIAGGEAGEEDNVSAIATYADDTKVEKLTPDQIDTVVKMYGQYLEQWKENANIYRQMAKQMNLTDMAMWALYTLRVEPGEMTQSRMCEFLHEPKQTINSALKKMEADGLITLQSGSNRRTKTIHLTAAGEALARETADRVAETEQQALAQFSEEEADQLFSLLRRLNALMIDIFPQTVRNQEEESQAK